MIGGFPHRAQDSFFHHATEALRREGPAELTLSQYTFGGFPVTRVPKHLKPRCLDQQPHIVVLQFASSDLIVPLHRPTHDPRTTPHRQVSPQPPKFTDRCKWRLQSLLGDLRQLTPVTPLETYLQTMEHLTRTLLDHKVTPVVLSPFVFGGGRSDRLARAASQRLATLVTRQTGALYVDAYSALDAQPRHQMLLKDGTHLSLAGHHVVAEQLLPALRRALRQRESLA